MESLLLFRRALPSPTMCRFIPALSVPNLPNLLSRISVPNLPDALAPNLSEAIQTDRRPAFAFSREIQFFLCFQTELALSRERIRGYRSQSSPTHL
jgi:hypothetical protein